MKPLNTGNHRESQATYGATKSKMPTLVVVDDEPALRLLLNEFFQKRFKVVTLEGGTECISYLQRSEPEVLILDLNMPGLSGLEVIRKIRKEANLQRVAIIILSSAESSVDRINCLEAGADDFVLKPFNPRELDARINAILRRINYHRNDVVVA